MGRWRVARPVFSLRVAVMKCLGLVNRGEVDATKAELGQVDGEA